MRVSKGTIYLPTAKRFSSMIRYVKLKFLTCFYLPNFILSKQSFMRLSYHSENKDN